MIKILINIFLIIVFAIQILPVQQVGRLLFGNQLTEEVPHALDDFAKDGCKCEGKSEFVIDFCETIAPHFTTVSILMKDLCVVFPHNHSTDIHTPPPNC